MAAPKAPLLDASGKKAKDVTLTEDVFGVGEWMSISRLCVRTSKCSRESLSLNGDRMTQYTFFSVGSGTGPVMVAPVR